MGEREKKIRIVIQVCSQGDQDKEERKYTLGPFQRLFKHFSIKLPVLDLFIQLGEKAPCFNIYALCTLQPRSFIVHSSVSNPGSNRICQSSCPFFANDNQAKSEPQSIFLNVISCRRKVVEKSGSFLH